MNFETPDLNREESSSVNQKELLSPYFLLEQARLPKNQWDEKFQKFIEEKSLKNQEDLRKLNEENSGEESENDWVEDPDLQEKQTFDRYLEGLGLREEDLKGKKILDLGCGEGEFVKYCLKNGLTSEAYGLDINPENLPAEYGDHFSKKSFEELPPEKKFDLIVSVGALSNLIWGGKETGDVKKIVKNYLEALKDNGEIRIYPIQEAAISNPLKGLEESCGKWKKIIEDLNGSGAGCRIEPRKIIVCGKDSDIVMESALIIKTLKK